MGWGVVEEGGGVWEKKGVRCGKRRLWDVVEEGGGAEVEEQAGVY